MASTMQSGDDRIIFVLGPPGSGKGTVCKEAVKLFERPTFYHLSVGDLLREICDDNAHYLDKDVDVDKISACMRENGLLPADVLAPIIKSKIYDPNFTFVDTWLIDGFPRNMDQLLAFEETVGKPLKVIVLECSRDTAKRRYLSRAREEMDDEERFDKRYDDYTKNMEDIRKHYENTGKLKLVPADADKETCLEEFVAAVPVLSGWRLSKR